MPIATLILFEIIAFSLWLTKDNLFYLINFSYIGLSISMGQALFIAKYKHARRVVQLLVGIYMLVYLGIINQENMQIEGFWYYLFMGVFQAATIHYAVAKIFGPLLFGRGWCGYACWTAMILDFLPYKVPQNHVRSKIGWIRYIMFLLSLSFVITLFLAHIANIERIISFSDQDVITRYFIKNKKYIDLFEHGVINYQTEFDGIEQKIKRIIFKMEKPYGRNKYVKNIFLRGSGKIPEDIKNKVKIIDLKELWNQLDFSSRNKILNVFGLDVEKLKIIETKNTILFTQPFSEDKVISEDEKIDLYKKIIKDYDRKSLVIKAHPREKTEYNKIFEDIMVLENTFPAELLLLNEFKFEKVVTISSTAVSVFFNKSEIDFYGSEVHPKILKYFGNLDFFMKRNKFIEKCSDSLEI